MRFFLILIIVSLKISLSYAQQTNLKAFFNADSSLVGYKDTHGKIVIPASLNADFGLPETFKNIISVIEPTEDVIKSYFLTRNGKVVGQDSLYFFDNVPDCENEGFIRFYDRDTDKMGLLNSKGEIQIDAEYSYIDRVKNGMIKVLKGATKTTSPPDDEHFFWEGGETSLIDTNNRVLIENFPQNDELDFYHVRINENLYDSNIADQFLGKEGEKYSFINFDKDFKQTLLKLVAELNVDKLNEMCFDTVAIWNDQKELVQLDKQEFFDKHYNDIKPLLEAVLDRKADFFISKSSLNQFIFESEVYRKYYNHCGDSMDWKYPVMSLIINHHADKNLSQSYIDFLKTDEGYKLILVKL